MIVKIAFGSESYGKPKVGFEQRNDMIWLNFKENSSWDVKRFVSGHNESIAQFIYFNHPGEK